MPKLKEKNELVVYKKTDFAALTDDGGTAQALAALAEAGETIGPSDLIRVKTPSAGATTWVIPGPAGEDYAAEIAGALVFYQPCGILWPQEEMTPGAMPVLRTFDLQTAEQVGPMPDEMVTELEPYRIGDTKTFHWSEASGNPYNQWGTGKNGQGKRCKEQRMLFILPQDALFPYVVVAQPGSVAVVSKWFKSLAMQNRRPYWHFLVSLSLKKTQSGAGIDYSQIVPRKIGEVDVETADLLHKTWTKPLAAGVAKRVAEQESEEE